MQAFDEYVSSEDPNYQWVEHEDLRFQSLFKGDGYVLNVTSQKWLNESIVWGPDGALWTHQVVIVIPKDLKYTNVSVAYLTGGCNESPNKPVDPSLKGNHDLAIVDEIAHNSFSIGIMVN